LEYLINAPPFAPDIWAGDLAQPGWERVQAAAEGNQPECSSAHTYTASATLQAGEAYLPQKFPNLVPLGPLFRGLILSSPSCSATDFLPFLHSSYRRRISGFIRCREFFRPQYNLYDRRSFVSRPQRLHFDLRSLRLPRYRSLHAIGTPRPACLSQPPLDLFALWSGLQSLARLIGWGSSQQNKRDRATYSDPSCPSPTPAKKRKKKNADAHHFPDFGSH